MKIYRIIPAALLLLVLAGCGKQHKAKALVSEFLEMYAVNASTSIEKITNLDSTAYINDEVIKLMRTNAKKSGLLKPEVRYGNRPVHSKTLLFTTVTYSITGNNNERKEYRQTFYLNPELTEVVAVKE
ncbi:MAG: hypothetical protein D8B52_07180 [Prevotella sp.]|nr:MAG: hypothetical protein D8B52_07180 [Prevotella sp.]